MKVISLASVMAILLSLTGPGCSSSQQEPRSSTAANSNKAPVPVSDMVSEVTYLSWSYSQEPLELARLSKQLGMVGLKDAKLSGSDTEIRVWNGFGLLAPTCLVLKVREGGPSAYYVEPKIANDSGVLDERGESVYIKEDLNPPRSGWDGVINYLRSEGVDSSFKLSLDTRIHSSGTDVGGIAIEAKTGKRYGIVYYAAGTTSQDGRKAINVCNRLEEEFGKRIGCPG